MMRIHVTLAVIATVLLVLPQCFRCESRLWIAPEEEADKVGVCLIPNCEPLRVYLYHNGHWHDGVESWLTHSDCETKQDLGTVLCPRIGVGSRCTLFSPWGTRVTSCADVTADDHVFAVPEGRLFILPTKGAGHRTEIHHLGMFNGQSITLETVSEYPRIFRARNFFTAAEARTLIRSVTHPVDGHTLQQVESGTILDESDRIVPGRTGDAYYDGQSELASTLRRRAFDLLGIFPYEEMLAEGLQITHYTYTQAYTTHVDWYDPSTTISPDHDFDSSGDGTNRFVTVSLFLSDVTEGGEIVFPLVPRNSQCDGLTEGLTECETGDSMDVGEYLEHHGLTEAIAPGTWEHTLLKDCKSRLAVKAKYLDALIYYAQKPNGSPDFDALHGSCPVIHGDKWVATLWIWNGPRVGYWQRHPVTNAPMRPRLSTVSASFESRDVVAAKLYWEDQIWEELIPGRPLKVNTYGGHKWHVKIEGELVATWQILPDLPSQRFVLSSEDLPVYYYAQREHTVIVTPAPGT